MSGEAEASKLVAPDQPALRPAWLPPVGTRAAVAAGEQWDAITIDGARGWSALMYLAELAPSGTGPVLCEPSRTEPRLRMTFLVPPGTAARWDEPGTTALGVATYVTVPGDLDGDDSTGLYWAAPPGIPEHVDPVLLRQALAATRRGAA